MKYRSSTFFTYELDYEGTLAAGQSVNLVINTAGDSDFFWQKFSAFALVNGIATTRGADQLPAVSMNLVNRTTGRAFMNAPVPIPNLSAYGQFLPRPMVWPRKSSVLVTLDNIDPQTVVVTSGFGSDAGGIGAIGEDVEFIGFSNNIPGSTPAVIGAAAPTIVSLETLSLAGVWEGFGATVFYLIFSGGAQNFFSQVTTQLGAGPINTYLSINALYLTPGQSGTIAGEPITNTSAGNMWLWLDANNDFVNGDITTLVFPGGGGGGGTSYSFLQLSFIGSKGFPQRQTKRGR